jgi:hypothetical protein
MMNQFITSLALVLTALLAGRSALLRYKAAKIR